MNANRVVIAVLIATTYGLAGVILYRQRVVSDAVLWNSDPLVFALPTAIAFIAFARTFWPSVRAGDSASSWSRVRALMMATLATGVTGWAYMVVALNRYGA